MLYSKLQKLSYCRQIARHLCTQYIEGICNNSGILKSRLGVIEGRWSKIVIFSYPP